MGTIDSKNPLVRRLRPMIELSTQTRDVAGVQQFQTELSEALQKIGFGIKRFAHPTGEYGDLLEGLLNPNCTRRLVVVCHADTCLSSADQPWTEDSESQTASGIGVIDNKGGVLVALHGLGRFLSSVSPDFGIQFVCSPNEEVGSPGFRGLLAEWGRSASAILGFEPALYNGDPIESRRGNRWYDVKILGVEGHAGRVAKGFPNAALEMARRLTLLDSRLNSLSEIHMQVGHLEGGRGLFNVVCGEMRAQIDTRFSSQASREILGEIFEEVFEASSQDFITQIQVADDCPPFSASDCSSRESRFLKMKYLSLLGELEGITPTWKSAGGASDVNYLCAHASNGRRLVMDGLGPIGAGMHTTQEKIDLRSLETRSQALSQFLNVFREQECTQKLMEEAL